jgi:hypothetical protein
VLATYAAAYLKAAKDVTDGDGADHVATGNAVLAAIAAADAICAVHLAERSRSQDHRHAVRMLRGVNRPDAKRLADALMNALDAKDASHYGIDAVKRDRQLRAIRAAELLLGVAREVTA